MLAWVNVVKSVLKVFVENEIGKLIYAFVGVLVLMLIDILTGFSQAKINRKLASSKMSDGLLKKFNLLMVSVGVMFVSVLLPVKIGCGLIVSVFLYEYVNELTSISENMLKMNIQVNFMQPVLKVLDKYLNNVSKGDNKDE